MKAQYENQAMSSFMLYIDHEITARGQAYTNFSSFLNETNQTVNGVFNYSAPYRQMVSDVSISGANVMTGLYLDGDTLNVGTSGLNSINYTKGMAHFTSQITGQNRISGDYSIKDYSVFLTNNSEADILFEAKYNMRPKINETPKPLPPDVRTYPSIFIKPNSSRNVPYAYGGIDNTILDVRCVVLADSSYSLDAVCSIMRDTSKTTVPFIHDNLPFNSLGGYTGVAYNYTGIATGTGVWIDSVEISQNVGLKEYNELSPDIYSAFADFKIYGVRKPREY